MSLRVAIRLDSRLTPIKGHPLHGTGPPVCFGRMTGHSETALCRRSRPYVPLRLAEDHSRETPFAEFQFYLDLHSSPIKAIDFKLAHQGPPPRSFVLQRRHGVDPGRFPSDRKST